MAKAGETRWSPGSTVSKSRLTVGLGGMKFYAGQAQAYCYRCRSEHRSEEPCLVRGRRPPLEHEREGQDAPTLAICPVCGDQFQAIGTSRGSRPRRFDTDECARVVRLARKRAGYDGRYDADGHVPRGRPPKRG